MEPAGEYPRNELARRGDCVTLKPMPAMDYSKQSGETIPSSRLGATDPVMGPAQFDALITASSPPMILVVIESRMSDMLKSRYTPEDIFQEALLHAWRDRGSIHRDGAAPNIKQFRAWLMAIVENRVRDLADHVGAIKRGGGVCTLAIDRAQGGDSAGNGVVIATDRWMPALSTTPSRVAMFREQAAAMQAALQSLPVELGEVVRLRLFEQRTLQEVADMLGMTESGVRHRLRKGAEMFQKRLVSAIGTRASRQDDASNLLNQMTARPPDSSSD